LKKETGVEIMKNLVYIRDTLRRNQRNKKTEFYLPEAWNCFAYPRGKADPNRPGELRVDASDFYATCIEQCFLSLPQLSSLHDCDGRLSRENPEEVLGKGLIYSMFPRAFTAWNHGADNRIYPGTFLKALGLLPYLKELGVDLVYLLPIFEVSERYKKGEFGSPYAIKNLYRLDWTLHDDLLGNGNQNLLKAEFKAFIEACHCLHMKVLVDFVFRTVSRDNDLLVDHPEWFYWISLEDSHSFAPPVVEKVKRAITVEDKVLSLLYTSSGISEYLNMFRRSPKETDGEKWAGVVAEHKRSGENILDLIEREFGLTTAPGFSDVLNDQQPPWADVTYLRYYHDLHPKARVFVGEDRPPYVLQDVACLNLYQGENPHTRLWEYMTGVIPYYQSRFGIDGARIDMGHALPPALNQVIISRTKATNPDFILWSEEFDPKKAVVAKEDGFHFITGDLWQVYKDLEKSSFCPRLFSTVFDSALPVTGALETADTPRAALVYQDRRKLALLIVLNYFLPNAVPFINNGLELMEIQPMNLGLDNTEAGRFVLSPADPMYGKLAFFDNYQLHWLTEERWWMEALLKTVFAIRRRFLDLIKEEYLVNKGNWIKNKKLIFFHYHQEGSVNSSTGARDLCLLANLDFRNQARINLQGLLKKGYWENWNTLEITCAGREIDEGKLETKTTFLLDPGAVIILYNDSSIKE